MNGKITCIQVDTGQVILGKRRTYVCFWRECQPYDVDGTTFTARPAGMYHPTKASLRRAQQAQAKIMEQQE